MWNQLFDMYSTLFRNINIQLADIYNNNSFEATRSVYESISTKTKLNFFVVVWFGYNLK